MGQIDQLDQIEISQLCNDNFYKLRRFTSQKYFILKFRQNKILSYEPSIREQ